MENKCTRPTADDFLGLLSHFVQATAIATVLLCKTDESKIDHLVKLGTALVSYFNKHSSAEPEDAKEFLTTYKYKIMPDEPMFEEYVKVMLSFIQPHITFIKSLPPIPEIVNQKKEKEKEVDNWLKDISKDFEK